jgi:hypothetical protein
MAMVFVSKHPRLDRLETAVWDALNDLGLLPRKRAPASSADGDSDCVVAPVVPEDSEGRLGRKGGTGNELSSRTLRILQPPGHTESCNPAQPGLLLPDLVTTVLRELVAHSPSQQGSDGGGSETDRIASTWEELLAGEPSASSPSSFSPGTLAFPSWVRRTSCLGGGAGGGDAGASDPESTAATTALKLEAILHLLTVLQLQRLSLRKKAGIASDAVVTRSPTATNAMSAWTLDHMIRSLSPHQLELFRIHEARLHADYDRRRRALVLRRDLQRQSHPAAGAEAGERRSDMAATSGSAASASAATAAVAAADSWRHRSIVDLMERLSRPHSSAYHISVVPQRQQQQRQQQHVPPRVALEGTDDRRGWAPTTSVPHSSVSHNSGRGRPEGEESRKIAAAWSTSALPTTAVRTGDRGGSGGGRRGQDERRGEESNRGKPNRNCKSSKNMKKTTKVA